MGVQSERFIDKWIWYKILLVFLDAPKNVNTNLLVMHNQDSSCTFMADHTQLIWRT